MNPDWRGVDGEPVADHAGHGQAQRGRIAFLEVVGALHGDSAESDTGMNPPCRTASYLPWNWKVLSIAVR